MSGRIDFTSWRIRKFLNMIAAMQLAMLGSVGLDAMGIDMPIIRQLIGFAYLAFIPGALIVRVVGLRGLDNIRIVLYTVGLSIATLMFTGLLINSAFLVLGIPDPMSDTPLVIAMGIIVVLLGALCYVRDQAYSDSGPVHARILIRPIPPILWLCILPLMAVLGAFLMNFHQNNTILMLMIVMITLTVVLISFDKFIPKEFFPFAIFAIAISLLFHRSLISTYLWGWDIQYEYYFSNLVTTTGYWDMTIPSNVNAMLSIVSLAPIWSIICNMDLIWVFKIIYPLLFSLVAVALYQIFRQQTNEKVAFLSCFFFISFFTFYDGMLQLARQEIAELFLVLIVLSMVTKDLTKLQRSFLCVVFGVSLAVSHYGLSYIFMFSLAVVWLLSFMKKIGLFQRLKNGVLEGLGKRRSILRQTASEDQTIGLFFVLLFITFASAWYIYISSSSTFSNIVQIGNHIVDNIFVEFLNPQAAQGMYMILSSPQQSLGIIAKGLHLIAQFLIAVGIVAVLLHRDRTKFNSEYVAFAVTYFAICLMSIAIPYFASALNTTRVYQITLIFLAPFSIVGGVLVLSGFCTLLTRKKRHKMRDPLKIMSIFLAIFFLFNVGFVYEVTGDVSSSISLDTTIDNPLFNDQEVQGANWLTEKTDHALLYADRYRFYLLGSLDWMNARDLSDNPSEIPSSSYVYLGRYNVEQGSFAIDWKEKTVVIRDYIDTSGIILERSKIYDNSQSEVYY